MRWVQHANDEDNREVWEPVFFFSAEDEGKQERWNALPYPVRRHICRWPPARRAVYRADLDRMAGAAQYELDNGIRP